MFAFLCTSSARALAATKPRPGGVIRPFCEPDIATSMPHLSISNVMQPSEATVSTMYSAGWPAALIALPIASMSFCTPEAVSTWTTTTALMVCSLSRRRRSSTSLGRTARRQSPLSTSTSAPISAAALPQPIAKRPLSSTNTLSPRDSTLLSAASQAP